MFGVLIGTLSLIGFIKVWKWGGHGHHGPRGHGRRRWFLRKLFHRLDTTPGQEKVIAQAVDDVERAVRRAKDAFFSSRASVAASVRGEHFDGATFDEGVAAQQAAADEVKKTLRESLAAVHEALTPEQRKGLGDLFEFGPRALHGHC